MNWFQNLSIRAKVISAFATVLAVTALLGVFSINRLSTVNDGAETVATNYLVGSDGLADFAYNAMRYRQLQAAHILDSAPAAKAKKPKPCARCWRMWKRAGRLIPRPSIPAMSAISPTNSTACGTTMSR